MAHFEFIAVNTEDKLVRGKVDLADRASVISALAKQNLRPVSIREKAVKKTSESGIDMNNLFGPPKVKSGGLVIFTRQLATMVGAGVPLLRALTSLKKHTEDKGLSLVLDSIIKDVEGGMPLGDALNKHPETFNDIYTNMVRAGEAAGILEDILNRLAIQQERSASLKKKVRSATAYPMVLMSITVLAFFGLMVFVVPQIGNIVKDLGGPDAELPLITQIMLSISDFLVQFWYLVLAAIAGLVFAFIRYIHTPKGRRWFDGLILKIPVIKTLVQKMAVARFSRIFSSLMGAGVAVLQALDVTSRAVGNVIFEEALQQAAVEVQEGKTLSSVIDKNDLFPGIVGQMLAVGEETGQTDTVLLKVADFFEEEVDLAIDSVSSIIEPVMIIVMGGMVGLIAASVMLPIAQLSQNIQ